MISRVSVAANTGPYLPVILISPCVPGEQRAKPVMYSDQIKAACIYGTVICSVEATLIGLTLIPVFVLLSRQKHMQFTFTAMSPDALWLRDKVVSNRGVQR